MLLAVLRHGTQEAASITGSPPSLMGREAANCVKFLTARQRLSTDYSHMRAHVGGSKTPWTHVGGSKPLARSFYSALSKFTAFLLFVGAEITKKLDYFEVGHWAPNHPLLQSFPPFQQSSDFCHRQKEVGGNDRHGPSWALSNLILLPMNADLA
jgi:hypothetical protein